MAIRRLRALKVCPVIKKRNRSEVNKRKEAKKKERYLNDEEFRNKIKERNRRNYFKNPAKANQRRTLLRQQNKERANEYARKHYQSTRARTLGKILSARKRRDPLNGIHSAILAYSNGLTGFSEVLRRIEKADKRVDEQLKRVICT